MTGKPNTSLTLSEGVGKFRPDIISFDLIPELIAGVMPKFQYKGRKNEKRFSYGGETGNSIYFLHSSMTNNRKQEPEPHDAGYQKTGHTDNWDTVPFRRNIG